MGAIEIAGLIVSGLSFLNDLRRDHGDLTAWTEDDIEVDAEWLDLALGKGVLTGQPNDFAWINERSLPTRELQGTHTAVVAHNDEKRIRYRIVRGRVTDPGGRSILVRRVG